MTKTKYFALLYAGRKQVPSLVVQALAALVKEEKLDNGATSCVDG